MLTYQNMKTSGTPWLGDIPSDWALMRVGQIFTQRNEKVSDKDYTPLSVTKKGIVPQLENAAKTNDGDNRKKVLKGDFVINSRSDRKGSSGLSNLDGSVSLINTVLSSGKLNSKYTHHLLRSYPFQEEFYRWGQGIVADLWSTNYQRMKSIQLPVPNIQAQERIAEFLDEETAKIDRLISKQEHLLRLLEEKRLATITHSVTCGLKTNPELKETGIPWLGHINEEFQLVPLKSCVSYQEGPGIMAADFHEAGVPLIRISGLKANGVICNGKNFLDSEKVEKKWSHFRLKSHDLLISASASTGVISEVMPDSDAVGAIAYTGIIRFQVIDKRQLSREYLKYFVLSQPYLEQIQLSITGTAMQHYGPSHLGRFKIIIPPYEQQLEIVQTLDSESQTAERLRVKIQSQITLLRERRTSLISHAVTGKIKI
ncbi:restriction endonuclease subunit S [Microbacteriaceae bacterium]|nr:restriction endonuclease subunit S [Candidatus Saccharibacteria bacterium]